MSAAERKFDVFLPEAVFGSVGAGLVIGASVEEWGVVQPARETQAQLQTAADHAEQQRNHYVGVAAVLHIAGRTAIAQGDASIISLQSLSTRAQSAITQDRAQLTALTVQEQSIQQHTIADRSQVMGALPLSGGAILGVFALITGARYAWHNWNRHAEYRRQLADTPPFKPS